MIENNRLSIVLKLLKSYDGSLPLRHFLKNYFKKNKKSGSTDRKLISNALYNYFRVCNAFWTNKQMGKWANGQMEYSLELSLTIALYLCNTSSNSFIDYCIEKFLPQELNVLNLSLDEKIIIIKKYFPEFNLLTIFPQKDFLSLQLNLVEFIKSFLIQPLVWVRVNFSHFEVFLKELKTKNIDYSLHSNNPYILSFNPAVKLTMLNSFEMGYFEIQDLSSIRVFDSIDIIDNEFWWDVCAGSGGKSLLLIEKNPTIKLFLSDSRLSILENLEERFDKIGFHNYTVSVLDLSSPVSLGKKEFDGLILDVPCSGSGTWGREPDNLSFFNTDRIKYYSELQFLIVKNSIPYLKSGKHCYYITCSVFSKENEENLERFEKELNLKVVFNKYLTGYDLKADTLFIAKIKKM